MRVLIYRDRGTHDTSAQALQHQLQSLLGSNATVKMVNSHYLKTKLWEHKTSVLVMGGGECSDWDTQLQADGVKKIHDFVIQGGLYLGFCAGAYFGTGKRRFSLLGREPSEKEGMLRFYPGLSVGPIIETADYKDIRSGIPALISLSTQGGVKSGYCYNQGGCSFDIEHSTIGTKVIAKYEPPYSGAAIISCIAGKGKAILSGLHPEFYWNASLADGVEDAWYCHLVHVLSAQEQFRKEVWQEILRHLFATKAPPRPKTIMPQAEQPLEKRTLDEVDDDSEHLSKKYQLLHPDILEY